MLRRIARVLVYILAALTVLLAIAVGLLRIALPQVPEYRDEIIARISETIDGDIIFDRLDARWRLFGPELVFHDVVIGERLGQRRIEPVEVEQITVGVSFGRLLFSGDLQVRRIGIRGATLEIRSDSEGWWLQDALLLPSRTAGGAGTAAPVRVPSGLRLPVGGNVDLRLDDVALRYVDRRNDREPLELDIASAGIGLERRRLSVDATLAPAGGGARAALLVDGTLSERSIAGLRGGTWSISVDLDGVSAALLRRLLPPQWRLPQSGRTDLRADAEIDGGRLDAAVLSIDAERLVPPDGGEEARVAGRVEWSRTGQGWLCAVSDFVVGVADRRWPAANVTVSLERPADGAALTFDAANVTVYDVPYLASFLPPRAADALLATGLSGTLRSGTGAIRFRPGAAPADLAPGDIVDYEINAAFTGIGIAPRAGLPGVRNLTGELRAADHAGRLRVESTDATLLMPTVFVDGLSLQRVAGTLVWRQGDRGVSVLSDSILVEASTLRADASLQLLLPADGSAPQVDVQAGWSVDDVSRLSPLLPDAVLRPKLYAWLAGALRAGSLRDGRFALRGRMDAFPFVDDDGSFAASAQADGVTMRYGLKWPEITDLTAEVSLDGMTLSTRRNSGVSGGVRFDDVNARFEDLRTGLLAIDATGGATLPELYAFAGDSPIRALFGEQFDNLRFGGAGDYALSLRVPVRAVRDFTFDATLSVEEATFALATLPHEVSAIAGSVRIDRSGVYADGVTGVLLGQPVTMNMAPATGGAAAGHRISGRGRIDSDALVGALGLPLDGRVSGGADYTANVLLPARAVDGARRPLQVDLESDLAGLAIDLPYPVGKTAEERARASAHVEIAEGLDVQAALADRVDVALRAARGAGGALSFDRLTIHLGEGRALLPEVPGVFIDGTTERLRLGDWLSLRLTDTGRMTDMLVSAAVAVGDLYVFGQRVRDVRASLERSGDDWLVDVQSPAIEGAISIPRDLRTGAPVVLDMRKLHLLEADPEAAGEADPTAFPPLRIRAASFALGDREFGALDASIDKTEDGLEATRLATAAPAFRIEGSGGWRRVAGDGGGSRSALTVEVTSTDVKRMMNSLGYTPGINAASLESSVDVAWDGAPGKDFVASLDGNVSLRITDGTLDEVEPGAGRVVGLMSVAELPRRLALDFRDVFQKGFNFDEIVGEFRLVNGDAYTCNLRLAGPSADVALIGRASLDKRNYNQTAVVGVKVGNTLPAVGAVVAGPQVGAALLLFSQIFKKPLQGMTEVYYQINGSWDEPDIERTDAARFVATSELAGCAIESGN